MNNGKKEYTLQWFVENYSYSWHKNGQGMQSPRFRIESLEGTAWRLLLYPSGNRVEDRGNISLFLYQREKDAGPEEFPLNIQLSFLATDGSALHSADFKLPLKKNTMHGSFKFLKKDEIHGQRKAEYLPNDTLSVCCKIWKGEGIVQKVEKFSARTRLLIEKISFIHVVDNFSALQSNVKQTFKIKFHSQEESDISSNLYFTDGTCCEKKIMIEFAPSDNKLNLQKCELYLLDKVGNLIECGGTDFGCEHTSDHIFKLPLSLTRKIILHGKSEYLTEDKLSLLCECTFSIGLVSEYFEETVHEIPLTILQEKIKNKVKCIAAKEYPNALEDFKVIYTDQCLTDIELKTKTKSFPAHKIVLCARSPVLKAMLTSDMKEKNTNVIHVDDLENDTVQQLLLFLYSDNLENLEWERATHLYYASDKYQIGKLKAMCSSFLVENLNATNASDLLLLVDTHNDSGLKKVVEDFILENEEQVFGSEAWDKLIEINPQLVIKTMHLKYKRKNEIS